MPIPRPFGQSPLRNLRHLAPPLRRSVGSRGTSAAARWASQQSRVQPQLHQQGDAPAESEQRQQQDAKIEGLPAPGEGIKLDVSGEGSSVSLGHLGPLVVNRDGTTGRVANWEMMTTHEKDTTLALLKKRNKARLDALKEDEETTKS